MNPFGWLGSLFGDADSAYSSFGACDSMYLTDDDVTNPANGLSMIGGYGGFDSEGNTYGTDFSNDTFRNDYSDSNGTSTFFGDW